MTAFDAWRISVATKMHFQQPRFDAFKFNFKAKNLIPKVFEAKREKYLFHKIAERYNTEDAIRRFAFANCVFGDCMSWVGNMTDQPYVDYTKRIQSFGYLLKADLSKVTRMPLDHLLTSANGNIPIIVKNHLEGILMFETVVILNHLTNFIDLIKVNDTMLWPEVSLKIKKSADFVRRDIDCAKAKKIIIDHFSGLQT